MPVAEPAQALPVRIIDGNTFDNFDEFCVEFSRSVLSDSYQWRGNLDALNDILRGDFGTPEPPWILRWTHVARSREVLVRRSNDVEWHLSESLFDTLLEIIRNHGVGGTEAEDGIILELEE